MPFNIDVSLDKSIDDVGPKLKQAQRKRLLDGADKALAVSQQIVPEDRGQLRQSAFGPKVMPDGTVRWGYAGPSYIRAQEFGTEPYWPPAKPLVEWAERIGKDPGFGYAVQAIIADKGIKEKRFARAGRDAQKRFYKSRSLQEYFDKQK